MGTGLAKRKHTEVLLDMVDLRGQRVLDIGCGDGALVRALTRHGAEAVGVTTSTVLFSQAQSRPRVGEERYLEALPQQLPLPDEAFDGAIFFNSLQHIEVSAIPLALKEACRILRPNGWLYVAEPQPEGALFDLLRAFEDEGYARAHAHRCLKQAELTTSFVLQGEANYDAPLRYRDFGDFRYRMESLNETRVAIFQAKEQELARAFETYGEVSEDAMLFHQPMQVSLLRKHLDS